ncbi:MAG: hypothetical protein AB7F86_13315 [Bdellovibrionales bacterium]
MKNVSFQIFWIAVGVALLTACQGQNFFKRQSNPTRKYPKVSESIVDKKGVVPYGQPEVKKPDPDNSQYYCRQPFGIQIENTEGGQVLTFAEGRQSQYRVSITNYLGDDFQVQVKAPTGVDITQTKKDGAKQVHQITWTPQRLSAGRFFLRESLSLSMTSASFAKLCPGKIARERITLLVEQNQDRPIVALVNLPQTSISSKTSEVPFVIEVNDRLGNPNLAPASPIFTFSRQAETGERKVLDAHTAVRCDADPTPMANSTKWTFKCQFLPGMLNVPADIKDSGKTVSAVFYTKVISKVNNQESVPELGVIQVQFEKPEPPAAPAAPAAPAPEAAPAPPTPPALKGEVK